MEREEVRNLNYRLDFEGREPQHASARWAPVERRSCGWQCLLWRRTSLGAKPNRGNGSGPMRKV